MTRTSLRKFVCSVSFCVFLFPALASVPSGAAENTYLLVGTVEGKDFTGAVIITPDGKQTFYRLRETLPDGAELVQVRSRSISLKGSDGSQYEMFITADGKLQTAASPATPAFTPPQAQPPTDQGPSRHRTRRSSSSDE